MSRYDELAVLGASNIKTSENSKDVKDVSMTTMIPG
jgi:hypothetical protein